MDKEPDMIAIVENTEEAMKEHGTAWGCSHILFTQEHINALLKGKQVALYDGEYMTYISMSEPLKRATS